MHDLMFAFVSQLYSPVCPVSWPGTVDRACQRPPSGAGRGSRPLSELPSCHGTWTANLLTKL